jgi:hypothetical protein
VIESLIESARLWLAGIVAGAELAALRRYREATAACVSYIGDVPEAVITAQAIHDVGECGISSSFIRNLQRHLQDDRGTLPDRATLAFKAGAYDELIAAMAPASLATFADALAWVRDASTNRDAAQKLATASVRVGALMEWVEVVIDQMDGPPAANCNCCVSPPCNDCVSWGGLREAISETRELIATIRKDGP